MKRSISTFLILSLFLFPLAQAAAEEPSCYTLHPPVCNPEIDTRDSTVLTMMGWGVGLAVGIGLLCGFLKQDPKPKH